MEINNGKKISGESMGLEGLMIMLKFVGRNHEAGRNWRKICSNDQKGKKIRSWWKLASEERRYTSARTKE